MRVLAYVLVYGLAAAAVFVTLILPVWSLVDAARRPGHEWRTVGREKTPWILLILLSWPVGAIAYVLGPRRDLRVDSGISD